VRFEIFSIAEAFFFCIAVATENKNNEGKRKKINITILF